MRVLSELEARRLERRDSDVMRRPSPRGGLELQLSGPGEIGMGASIWGEARLLDAGRDVTSQHPLLRDCFGWCVAAIDFYYPWDRTGTTLALSLMDRDRNGKWLARIVVYDTEQRTVLWELQDTWCSGLVWSPLHDEMLVIRHEESEIAAPTGDRRTLPYPSHAGDGVLGAWTPDGRHVALSPPSEEGKPQRLLFIEATSGDLIREEPFDPREVLSFDEDRFRGLLTNQWMVDLDRPFLRWSAEMFESLMHHWHDVLFDAQTFTLTMSVYRPTFEVTTVPLFQRSRRHGSVVASGAFFTPDTEYQVAACTIRRHWVSVSLHN